MKLGITSRLFLSMLAATSLAIACMFLVAQWSIHRGFLQYLAALDRQTVEQAAERLESLYAERGTLESLRDRPRSWTGYLLSREPEDEPPSGGPPGPGRPGGPEGAGRGLPPGPGEPGRPEGRGGDGRGVPPAALLPPLESNRPERRLIVLDAARTPLLGMAAGLEEVAFRPLRHQGRTVGYVGMLPPRRFLAPTELHFISRQQLGLVLAACGVVLAAALLSLPLARRLVRPIRSLAAAARELASGRYAVRVPIASTDELGRLAGDFNALALALEKNEGLRRRWVADISHELRTPLAVLRGEIEALLEGIRPTTPETIRSLHAEVLRLGRLVDDLYQLSLSDLGALSYRKEELDPAAVLERSLDLYRPEFARKGIALAVELPPSGRASLFGDPERLGQLFANLLDNSLKYTEAGGRLTVRLARAGPLWVADFQDSAPGVPEAERERLFERLYRVEGSRSRTSGGAGLGLAICRSIVEAHGGEIIAQASPFGGVWIRVDLPASGEGA